MADQQRFYVQIEDTAGTVQGSGPLRSVERWRYTARLDRAGSIGFTFSAGDEQAAEVTAARIARAYARLGSSWVEVGAGIIDGITTTPTADGRVVMTVSGRDLIGELSYRTVGELEIGEGAGATLSSSISSIASVASGQGWTLSASGTPDNDYFYQRFGGESVLGALVLLAERTQTHFYRSDERELTFTSDWADSGVRAIEALPGDDLSAAQCAIVDLSERIDSHDLLTRIIPYGGGTGAARLTLAATSRAAPAGYTLDAANNYIQADSAYSTYGLRDHPEIEFKDITPISNTDADLAAAADMLFDAALEELARRSTLASQKTYTVRLAGCQSLLRPMQTINVVYRDVAQNIDIDADLYILEATWEVGENGVETTDLVVSTQDRWPQSDASVVSERIAEGRVFQAHPQMGPNSYTVAYTKRLDHTDTALFRFRLGDEIVTMQQALFEFQILDFESTVRTIASSTAASSLATTGPSDNNTSAAGLITTGSGGGGDTGSGGGGDSGSGGGANTGSGGGANTGSSGAGDTGSTGAGNTGGASPATGGTAPNTGSASPATGGTAPNTGSASPLTGSGGGANTGSGGGGNTGSGGGASTGSGGGASTGLSGSGDTGGSGTLSTGSPTGGDVVSGGQHQHSFTITTGGTISYTVGFGAAGPAGGLVTDYGSAGSTSIVTNQKGNHTHSISDHTHTIATHTHTTAAHTHTTAAHTHTTASHTHTTGTHTHTTGTHTHTTTSHTHTTASHTHTTTSHTHTTASHTHTTATHTHTTGTHTHTTGSHTHSISSHTHTTATHTHTIASHTHSLSDHTHDLADHTHDLGGSITPQYGLFRDASANTFALTDLDYRVNGGSWVALSGAISLGDGWYQVDITSAVINATTFRPSQANNYVEIRGNGDTESISQIAGDGSTTTITVATGTAAIVDGIVTVSGTTNYNGTYTVESITTVGPNDEISVAPAVSAATENSGTMEIGKRATIDAQLAIRNTIQAIAYL